MEENLRDQEVQPINAAQGDENDPKVQAIIKKAKGYETVLKNLIHGKKTRDEVINMLKGGDAIMSVPQAAMTINDMAMDTMNKGGLKPEASVQMVASAYLIDDLIQLGEAAGAFQTQDGDLDHIMEDTYQMYIERGLKDKSIDPIQLQLEAEKAMSPEQMAGGLAAGHGEVPRKPSQEAMINQQVEGEVNRRTSAQAASQAKAQAKEKQKAMTQQALAQQTPQQGGQ
jgi:hypothetical protein